MKFINKLGAVLGFIKRKVFEFKLRKASPIEKAEIMRDKFYFIGKNVQLFTNAFGTEPYLISIHDNVTCAAHVAFITHDVSIHNLARTLNLPIGSIDKVGSIELFDNCFIGAYTILMPNCSVGKNSIVGAGSIVTKHIPDNEVWGGCPARFIMSVKDYAKKMVANSEKYPWMPLERKMAMSEEELKESRKKYFFKK